MIQNPDLSLSTRQHVLGDFELTAMVGTFDFQAKSFYENHGYMVNDTMSGVPKGHEHYFMTKRLDRII